METILATIKQPAAAKGISVTTVQPVISQNVINYGPTDSAKTADAKKAAAARSSSNPEVREAAIMEFQRQKVATDRIKAARALNRSLHPNSPNPVNIGGVSNPIVVYPSK